MSQELTIVLSDMAHGGEAVGRYEGKAIFVPYAIPGESVRVYIVQDKGRFAHARLLEVLTPSPQRVQPPCPYFGLCGGCHWQHLSYEAQLEHKRSIVRSQLQHIAGLPEANVRPTLGMTNPWHYRNHVQFHVSLDGQLGFVAADDPRVVPIEQCLLLHPLLQDLFDSLDIELTGLQRLSLRAGVNTGEQMIIFEIEADQPPELETELPVSCVLLLADGTPVTLLGSPYFHERVADRLYRISAPSFFQVNTDQTEVLLSVVSAYLDPTPESIVLDVYCGVGTFGLAIAAKAKQVIGIESNPVALADAQANAAGTDNVRFIGGLAEEIIPTLDVQSPLVLVDPPRAGVDKNALSALVRLGSPRIVYVSCDPATLARDIQRLLASGYRLCEVQPIDMFPQTYHIECVALLERQ
ncbi:MAG: 23S rRNA (uracil(1939)-C(5))-methyltransferase RlmD [Chloroflexi bacterium]|nr:23S rRNA (uracil(1939)-C(5))-methyltransferase RlmD [Chloroflexota bacterium]